jgi:demethylmenaquinone methyltransferase / 2-methoxy-6-polyprenyl-1,4-benzoquinol methylase
MAGLGNTYWREVIQVLRNLIPVYNRVNRAISLGQDVKHRKQGLIGRVNEGDLVLDAGSGFGNMTLLLSSMLNNNVSVVMYDPISEMLETAKKFVGTENFNNLSCGVFEGMPFRDEIFDAVLCGYSLRDSISLVGAISEIHRILKKNGRLVVVDLGKPDNNFFRWLVSIYLKYLLKVLAFSVSGRQGLKFKTLYGTYVKWPKNSELYVLLANKFSKVDLEERLFGGAIIVAAYK